MGDRTPDHEGLAREIRALKERVADHEERLRNMAGEMDGEIARRKRLEDRVAGLEDGVQRAADRVKALEREPDPTPSSGEGRFHDEEALWHAAEDFAATYEQGSAEEYQRARERLFRMVTEEAAAMAPDSPSGEGEPEMPEADGKVARHGGTDPYWLEPTVRRLVEELREAKRQAEAERRSGEVHREDRDTRILREHLWAEKAWQDLLRLEVERLQKEVTKPCPQCGYDYGGIQPPEDGGGEPSEDAPGSEGERERHEAGRCTRCGGPVYHRPGKPGEFDHDWDACDEAPEGEVVLNLCEASRLHLKPDTRYRFRVDPECAYCREAAAEAGCQLTEGTPRSVVERATVPGKDEDSYGAWPTFDFDRPNTAPTVPTEAPEGEDPLEVTEEDVAAGVAQLEKDEDEADVLAILEEFLDRLRARIQHHYRPRRVTEEEIEACRGLSTDNVLRKLGLTLAGEEGR